MADVVVAVTGGVASGKSECTRAFAARGLEIADADVAARAVVAPGEPALAAIAARFGPDMLAADGTLDRAAMRRRVFADTDARRELEALLHPPIRRWLQAACSAAAGPYVVVAIPLLAEGGGRAAYPWLARIVVVDVPEAVQEARLMRRDGVDAALARRMIAAQATRRQRLAIADDVIVNDGPIEHVDACVGRLDARYRR
jgi:dephospho-CoA kinase